MTSQHKDLTSQHKDLTSQHKYLTSQHNYLTSDGRNMPQYFENIFKVQQIFIDFLWMIKFRDLDIDSVLKVKGGSYKWRGSSVNIFQLIDSGIVFEFEFRIDGYWK